MIFNIEENKEREGEREEGNERLFCALLCIDTVSRRIRKMQHVTVSCRAPNSFSTYVLHYKRAK